MSQPEIYIRPSVGISRAVIAVIDDLQLHLQHPEREPRHVHRIRVDIKRLRAWLRLIRNKSGTFNWRTVDNYFRDSMKKLSAKRDAQVILETLKWLEDKTDKENEQSAIQVIRAHIQFEPGGHELDWETVRSPLVDIAETLKRQTLSVDSDDMIKKGLKRTYKRTCNYGKKAFSAHTLPEDLHQLRKWVKYLCFQIGFIQASYPGLYEQIRNRLDKLGNRLGRIHDLILVQEKLEQLSTVKDCIGASKVTAKIIDKKFRTLLKRSNRFYQKIFTLSPAEFIGYIS
ncbi:CHAD domain-containing protein [bacterium]|nr:CHAD domain-containing protein [bacterium]